MSVSSQSKLDRSMPSFNSVKRKSESSNYFENLLLARILSTKPLILFFESAEIFFDCCATRILLNLREDSFFKIGVILIGVANLFYAIFEFDSLFICINIVYKNTNFYKRYNTTIW